MYIVKGFWGWFGRVDVLFLFDGVWGDGSVSII